MNVVNSTTGDLTLGHVMAAAGLDVADVIVLRHTLNDEELKTPSDVTPENVWAYTRRQGVSTLKFPKDPPKLWLAFMADGGRRARFLTAFDNRGELPAERTNMLRHYDLHESDVLSSLKGRLVIEWSKDTINWAKTGAKAAALPVVEIADPESVPFPGFDKLLIDYAELGAVVDDSRYAAWRHALGAVQGIYLIADKTDGKLYVGKADGGERILGRWRAYAHDGHGGNKALKELAGLDPSHSSNFVFSILRVFGPSTPTAEVDAAEAHFKRALLTREYGHNRN